ncbi:ASKHA domain-containing protein [Sunxiuqinia indica]|uniref:ASKHA domain-containing protein n=1 Tax=Sunxiuqinia indica TaxID=2692584 RepID=UPI00135B128D|nr:ASKHA domain-containing protein [Sunxiuqinia indica]
MKEHLIRLHPLGKEIQVNHQTPLIDVLHEYGIEFPCGGKGTCGKCKVKLLDGSIDVTDFHRKKITEKEYETGWRLACLSHCTGDITLEVDQFNHLILADESEYEYVPQSGYGIAVDLGTTTLVAQLVDLSTAKVLAAETMLNPQVKYGADLISRIQACVDGLESEMTQSIRQAVGQMIGKLIGKHDVPVKKIVIVGNTAMQLIFSGDDVSPLAAYPFRIKDVGEQSFSGSELNWDFQILEKVQFFPPIESFVGSDILAGIVATGIYKKDNYVALVDLGTNGEIVIGNKHQMVCASTAAGPAFEGANISMGMRAVTGAISSLHIEDGQIHADVIGKTSAKGICGSALIDAIAILRRLERLGQFGEIQSGEEKINLFEGVKLSQKDIHEFQLAKAAIAAGLSILASSISINMSDIDELYIAGGFGSYINVEHVIETGMLEVEAKKVHKMGNTALIGAKIFLFNETNVVSEVLSKIRHINLEGDPNFMDIYVEKMQF